MSIAVLTYLLVILIFAFLGGALLRYLKQPPVVGYLLAGLTLGILFGGTTTSEIVNFLSELGIVLLLFTLGLDFSITRLRKVARIAVIGGLIQVLLTIATTTLFIQFLGFTFFQALFMASAFSMSSTAVLVKILTDKGQIDTLHGEILVGWSVVQDLVVLPMIVLLPLLGKITSGATNQVAVDVFRNLVLAFVILVIVGFLGKQVIPILIKKVAELNNRELLLVAVFMLAVLGALLTQAIGLSAALGAFLIGIMLAPGAQSHAILAEIRPVRDIFALLFFTTLGLLIPAGFMFAHFAEILTIAAFIMLIKFLLSLLLTFQLGYHGRISFIVGLGLIEVGEFAFVLARVGMSSGVIDATTFGLIISVALISILFMPPLFLSAPQFYERARDYCQKRFNPFYLVFFAGSDHHVHEELPFRDHVVLCGYGRVGRYIGRALAMAEVPFVVIEYNHHTAHDLKSQGIEVVYGDPTDRDILDYAQVDKARAIIIAIPDLHTQQLVIANSLKLNRDIQIFCRTHHEEHQKLLKDLGVHVVVQPEFEASLSITNKVLKLFGQKEDDIEGKISRLKIEHGVG